MLKYIYKRILSSILVLLGVVTITFFIARVIPSNPEVKWAGQRATAEQLEAARIELGLDRSLPEQYLIYLRDLLHGNMGKSLRTHQPVASELQRFIPATLELVLLAFLLAIIIGIPLGIYSAKKKDRLLDHISRFFSIGAVSLPTFWVALFFQLIFYKTLSLLPIGGRLSVEATIFETVLERTNSKGKTTSLVTFTVKERTGKNFWSFLGKDLPSSKVLIGILALMGLSLIFAAAGLAGSLDLLHRYLDTRSKLFRTLLIVVLLLAILLVPVFILQNNVTFSRQLSLYNTDLLTEGKDAFFAKLDGFLFGDQMGSDVADVLSGLEIEHSPLVWLMIPTLFISLLAAFSLRKGEIQSSLLKLCLYFFVIVVCVITLYPYYVMLITAFRSNAESLDMYFLHMFPTEWIWSNLTDIIHRGVPRFLLNSLFVAGGATGLAMLCGIPAAYALARMTFKGKKIFLGYVIMSQMFSPVVLLIGISQLMTTLHLNNTLWGLMLINAAFNQAFAIWLLRGTFVSISPEMEQAALIDGCGTVGALTKVLIPMAAPGIVTALIFVFINAWNEYTVATILISTAQYRPITVGITQFSSFNMIEWQYMFAASLLATIPVVILFMFIEKHLTAGLTSGGVKG